MLLTIRALRGRTPRLDPDEPGPGVRRDRDANEQGAKPRAEVIRAGIGGPPMATAGPEAKLIGAEGALKGRIPVVVGGGDPTFNAALADEDPSRFSEIRRLTTVAISALLQRLSARGAFGKTLPNRAFEHHFPGMNHLVLYQGSVCNTNTGAVRRRFLHAYLDTLNDLTATAKHLLVVTCMWAITGRQA